MAVISLASFKVTLSDEIIDGLLCLFKDELQKSFCSKNTCLWHEPRSLKLLNEEGKNSTPGERSPVAALNENTTPARIAASQCHVLSTSNAMFSAMFSPTTRACMKELDQRVFEGNCTSPEQTRRKLGKHLLASSTPWLWLFTMRPLHVFSVRLWSRPQHLWPMTTSKDKIKALHLSHMYNSFKNLRLHLQMPCHKEPNSKTFEPYF